jgi:3-phosphoshikimate 1-carboxyvinyltransferase
MPGQQPIIVDAPASKSVSHRALICAALADGESELHNVLESVDLTITRAVLEGAGAAVRERGGVLFVDGFEDGPAGASAKALSPEKGDGAGKPPTKAPVEAFMAESGTSCRLLTAVLAAGSGAFRVFGAPRMHQRPIGDLTDALAAQGARFSWEGEAGYPPFVLTARGLKGGRASISLEQSSQYLSGLLLAAPLAQKPLTIEISGTKAVSWPYVALTLSAMADFKADFDVSVKKGSEWAVVPWRSLKGVAPGEVRFTVRPGRYQASRYRVEADWSGGSYLLAAGAVGARPVHVRGLRSDSLQGDRALLRILQTMGAKVEADYDGVTVFPSRLRGAELDMADCPDLVPTVAVLAAFAEGPTTIRGVAHLRIKECDRIAAMVDEVARAGAATENLDDGLRVTPGPLAAGPVRFQTYGDHRIAMSTAIFGLGGIEVDHDDPGCVSKSFPAFFDVWQTILEGNR